jgi:NADPH:quinone reductase-like Zn-dependent oxidoreductase
MSGQIRLQGIEVGSKDMFYRMNRAIELNRINPVVDKVLAFGDARETLTSLEQGSHFGKICLSF